VLKKIIVPLDGSELAEVALPYAEELTGKMGSEIILLSVLASEETQEYLKHRAYAEKTVSITRKHIEKYVEVPEREAIRIGAATRAGNPAEGILDYVGREASKMIVMATHGRSGISRWALGSVADKIVQATKRQPLLLIRAKGRHPDVRAKRILKKVLVPLDGSPRSEAVVPCIMAVARSLYMEVTLLRVVPRRNRDAAEIEDYLHGWCRRFEEKAVNVTFTVKTGAAAEEIINLADETAADMVAMSTRGQTAGNIWPLGSVAQKVLLGGNTPLLLIRA
jgi:nucleotide-binding universal stress UspA family protein